MKTAKAKRAIMLLGIGVCLLCSGTANASDTDIFTSGQSNVPPNVLIILDTSGSMSKRIDTGFSDYISYTTYSGSYRTNQIFFKNENYAWEPVKITTCTLWSWLLKRCILTDTHYKYIDDITCASAKTSLIENGRWIGALDEPNYACGSGNNHREYATGNFLNYLAMSDKDHQPKIDIAKKAISNILDSVDENAMRFGVMRFNGLGTWAYWLPERLQNRGGRLVAKCGSSHSDIKEALRNLKVWCTELTCGSDMGYPNNPYSILNLPPSSGATPLGETLAEAGLYFAGKKSWAVSPGQPGYPGDGNDFGMNGVYTSPIEWRCQKNYVIVVTDGMPEDDRGEGGDDGSNIFTKSDYINGKSIGKFYPSGNRDIDRDGDGSHSNYWMDDTAKFLYDVDLIDSNGKDNPKGGSFNEEKFNPQRILTYTIGFGSECDNAFLERVTDSNHGHGKNFIATDKASLEDALASIVGGIMKNNASFVSPVVPLSRSNKMFSGNSLYVSLFKPAGDSFWMGNLKKFGYNSLGQITDKNGNVANFSSSQPTSCWGTVLNDGIDTSLGGAGEVLLSQKNRNFYTYNSSAVAPRSSLADSENAFSVNNAALTKDVLGIESSSSQTTEDLINFVRAEGDYTPKTGKTKREWVLGDIMHSRPTVMRTDSINYIFVGANDGFLHCFEDNEGGTTDSIANDTITEKWSYIPWDLMVKLNDLKNTSTHQYFVDGSPVLYTLAGYKYLTFGLRRGGTHYYTLKVGQYQNDKLSYISPSWAWGISDGALGMSPGLGQSWCTPKFCKLKNGGSSVDALILTGGYDEDNQDLTTPDAKGDSRGMSIYAVRADTGKPLRDLLACTNKTTSLADMNWSIVDFCSFDTNNDGCTDRIYAGDMGGQIFALNGPSDGSAWTGKKIFQAGRGTSETAQMKFFYAPDVAMQGYKGVDSNGKTTYTVNDYVYIGTGDREHPLNTAVDNRFYAIKNRADGTVVTENTTDFRDVTYYSNAYDKKYDAAYYRGSTSRGWYIRLGYELGSHVRPGEKVSSSPIIFDGIVYFTTYVPETDKDGEDKCNKIETGDGYLYAVDYLTGEAIRGFGFNMDVNQTPETVVLNETHRRTLIGSGLPTPPRLTVTPKGPVLVVGTKTIPVPFSSSVKEYFWLQ